MRKKAGGLLLFFLFGLLALGCHRLSHYVMESSGMPGRENKAKIKIVIDAGHGGEDGGKVGVNGESESEINLQIAVLLREKLDKKQFQVLMTREGSRGMADGNAADLKARAEMINKEAPDLAVSIHQNSYSDPSVKGAQVFYHEESGNGKRAAEIMQESLRLADGENRRQAKGNASYYLLKNTKAPVIIVECGFLSNPEEAGLLTDEAYQERLADAIRDGILSYFGIAEK